MVDGSEDLFAKGELRQDNENLFADAIITHYEQLFADGIITHWERLFNKGIIRHTATKNLFAKAIIRHTATKDLFSKGIIRHSDTKDLFADAVITHWERLFVKGGVAHWEDLKAIGVIRHTATKDLPADGYVRWPYRLWTTRRYINGVIDAAEELIGDAKLEYIIEGVMDDVKVFLFENSISTYEQWYTIEDVPIAIRRATTYGVVASLYSRHTNTFRSRVIPSVAPVTVTVKGDAEVAMDHWEGRYERMLNAYLTAINSDRLLVSTADQEPVFDKELSDIPPGVTSSEYWYEWVNRTEGELSE